MHAFDPIANGTRTGASMFRLEVALLLVSLMWPHLASAQPVRVAKTNPLPVYMHYMPWFETPDTLGGEGWGWHWTFNNQHPDTIDADGRHQIASHYYPLIGPYASGDQAVIEYHLLLMKYAGIDGIAINWYGVQGTNGDVDALLANSNAVVDASDVIGLDVAVVFEDRFAKDIDDARANMAYLRDHYFSRSNYIRRGAGADPLVMVFGPITFESPAAWADILSVAGEDVALLTLWYESADAGEQADGEFLWIYEDESLDDFLSRIEIYYESREPMQTLVGGIAYPGFVDFYEEGGVGQVVAFEIPHESGQTLAATLELAEKHHSRIDFLQLATWNDFGEGTVFEPTRETGFDYLVQIQHFTGSPYSIDDLQLIHRLYLARKAHADDADTQTVLDNVATQLAELHVQEARSLLDSLGLRDN